jgi:hypothetical protein
MQFETFAVGVGGGLKAGLAITRVFSIGISSYVFKSG